MNLRDIEEIFAIALSKGKTRHPDIVTIYAYHIIYNLGDLRTGEQLFYEATRLSPHNAQYRINLVKLLILTEQYDKVREQIDLLQQYNPLGKNNTIIQELELALQASEESNKGKNNPDP